jgi:hypothetical protein
VTALPASEDDVLAVVVQALWPDSDGPTRRVRVLPSADRPRLLVPERPRRAAAVLSAALRGHDSRGARLRNRMLRFGFATGTAGVGPGDWTHVAPGGIETHLASRLGEPVVVAVHLGPPRANRKPVLAVARPDGSLLGFAKLGIDPLSDDLVRNECAALARLTDATLPTVVVPQLLDAGSYEGHPLLVQSVLPVAGLRTADADTLARAQVEVARAFGVTTSHLTDASYVRSLRGRAEAVPSQSARLTSLVDQLRADRADAVVAFGCWHGDWRSVNVATGDGKAWVWDWERFTENVPLGFDALHQWLASANREAQEPARLAGALTARAGDLLAQFGVERRDADLVSRLYLLELAVRYLTDDQAGAGARLGRVDTWLLPFLEERAVQP